MMRDQIPKAEANAFQHIQRTMNEESNLKGIEVKYT